MSIKYQGQAMVDPSHLLQQLLGTTPVSLAKIPTESGIYALYDHEAQPRYIGITSKGLKNRINSRHAAGDGNSHKFSTVYNAGRMFHTRDHRTTCSKDGPIAKELRRLFIREHCSAVAIPLPDCSFEQLLAIEKEVCSIAPGEAVRWNDVRDLEAMEPIGLLDCFLKSIGWPDEKRLAVERQAVRWKAR